MDSVTPPLNNWALNSTLTHCSNVLRSAYNAVQSGLGRVNVCSTKTTVQFSITDSFLLNI